MTDEYYITTAIPYVNAEPHIGFALEVVQADTIARYHRLLGEDVLFSSGTDENSLKNVQAAEQEALATRELVDKYALRFNQLKPLLNLSYDVFNRTASPAHFAGAQKLWLACKKEDIYKKKYRGLYCVGCEAFYTKDELVDGNCPEHGISPEEVGEENYFFRLSSYQKFLENLIKGDKLKIIPETRKNEVLSFIKQGLQDFSISRSVGRARGWGVPVPGDPSQIEYVWFDALSTYLTALGYGSKQGEKFKKYWLENKNRVHVIGKGIIRFHAVYWPAMLRSAGLPLPSVEFVHGYVTVNGQKISKSLGNAIDPFQLVEKYNVDPIRYYLLREIPSYSDGDFSEKRFRELYNADLANGLGNLVARVARLCETTNLHVSKPETYKFPAFVRETLENFQFDLALQSIWERIRQRDRQIDVQKPWENSEKKHHLLVDLVEGLREIAYDLKPFLPQTAEKILKQFSGRVKSAPPLFPRLD